VVHYLTCRAGPWRGTLQAYLEGLTRGEREADVYARTFGRADLEALIPVAEGRMSLIVTVDRAADILQVIRLGQEEGVRMILDGAAEGWLVADQIAAANVPVLLNPIMNLPDSFDSRAARMENAAGLDAAGVIIAIKGNEGSIHRAKETRYNAGNAVSHGLPYDAAIEAITVNPAKIFGMAGQFGELRAGAAADFRRALAQRPGLRLASDGLAAANGA
jgi:imidazolonepropionase-like amidohydrolase